MNEPTSIDEPASISELSQAVRDSPSVRPRGGGSKSALSCDANLSLGKLTGVMDYDPGEFTFSARAGTTLAEVNDLLGKRGQFLPFDPPFVESGATLGGAVGAGLSGSASFRYGTIRDYILGVRFVTGQGEVVFGGGKVVKNAAGFDFPKLMVGALGQFGVLAELTFKVFPRPQRFATLRVDCGSREFALRAMRRLATSNLDLTSLDLDSRDRLWVRVGGRTAALDCRLASVRDFVLQDAENDAAVENIEELDDEATARELAGFSWSPAECALVKVCAPLTKLVELVDAWDVAEYRIVAGGHVLWLAWPESRELADLETQLWKRDCGALVVSASTAGLSSRSLLASRSPLLGSTTQGAEFAERMRSVLDPEGKLSRFAAVSSPS